MQGNPIFIGGLGRSGTTLLSLMLDSHRDIKCGPELHFRAPRNLGRYIVHCMEYVDEKEYSPEARPGCMFIVRTKRLGIMPGELKHIILSEGFKKYMPLKSFADRAHLINTLGVIAMESEQKNRWGLKIMTDIGSHIGKYAEQWPNAQFIHVIKDPRDNVYGLSKVNWGPKTIEKGALQWVHIIEESRKQAGEYKISFCEVKFNDLVSDPKKTMKEILQLLGEDYDPDVLRHHEMPHSFIDHVAGHPSAKQVVHPIDPSYVGQYKKGLDQAQINMIEEITMPLIKKFGLIGRG